MAEAPPPAYTSVVDETQPVKQGPPATNYSEGNVPPAVPDEPPPSYDSLFGRVKAAKQTSGTKSQFFKSLLAIFIGTLGCTICLGLILAIPISMIVMGAIYKEDCRAERFIPIYLIVAGSVGIIKNLSTLGQKVKNDKENQEEENVKSTKFDMLLNCFLFAWFIAGNVWIYRTSRIWSTNPESDNYCNPTLFVYAFWITTSVYILMGTVCCCMCCAGIISSVTSD